MRIITGSARGIALKAPEGEKTRPTTEKIKEAIFSSLQFDLEGRSFLDLFAGSGQMGLEALSRGAVRAVFIDEGRDTMEIVKENAKKTGFFEKSHFLVSDYRNYLRKAAGRERFDIVFIDPPYAERIAADAMFRVIDAGLAKHGTLFVLEGEDEDVLEGATRDGLELQRAKRYGRTWVHVFRYVEEKDDE